jgi:predicted nucleic acid-binding protein
MLGYVRMMTNRSVLLDPFLPVEAIGHVRSWLPRPQVVVLGPGARHLDLVEQLMVAANASGQLTTDVHVAALAIEHQAQLCSND